MKKAHIIIITRYILLLILSFCLIGCKGKVVVSEKGKVENKICSKPNLKVFLENSGSMDGYMIAGSELKDAIYSYVSDLIPVTDTLRLYYINSSIIARPDDLGSYIKNLNPTSFASAGGNRANSDIGKVIKDVLDSSNKNDVSLLISDFILDLPSGDSNKFLTNMSIQIKNEINKKLKADPDFGIIILQMESDFKGRYFYPNGASGNIDGKRPYYIWIFGNKNYLAQLKREVPFSKIKHGYKNYVAYSSKTSIPFTVSNVGMTSKMITEKRGVYEIMLRADFSGTLQPEGVITNPANYQKVSPGISIAEIKPIVASGDYTHYIILNLDRTIKITEENITFHPPHMPKWVEESNDETAFNISENMNKTTGIKSLIEGVSDAYDKHIIATNFNFNIKRK